MDVNWQAVSAVVAAVGILFNAQTALYVFRENVRKDQRRDLIPIWKEMLLLDRIDANNPNPDSVRHALNLLGLIATCHDLGVVEPRVLSEMFRGAFLGVVGDIRAISTPITIGLETKPGRDYLQNMPRVEKLYAEWAKQLRA
jgi:hypothetical protein